MYVCMSKHTYVETMGMYVCLGVCLGKHTYLEHYRYVCMSGETYIPRNSRYAIVSPDIHTYLSFSRSVCFLHTSFAEVSKYLAGNPCLPPPSRYVCMYVCMSKHTDVATMGMYVCLGVSLGKHTYLEHYRYVCMSGETNIPRNSRYVCMSKVCISGETYIPGK